MMYLRHEAGHAFNHAYELDRTDEWRELLRLRAPSVSRRLSVRPLLARLRPLHPRLVRAEASRRRLRRDVRGLARSRSRTGASATRAGARCGSCEYVDRIAHELGGHAAAARRRPDRHHRRRDGADRRGDSTASTTSTRRAIVADLALDADLLDIFTPAHEERDAPAADLLARASPRHHRQSATTGPACAARSCARSSSRSSGACASCELVATRERAAADDRADRLHHRASMTFLTGKKRLRHRRPTR